MIRRQFLKGLGVLAAGGSPLALATVGESSEPELPSTGGKNRLFIDGFHIMTFSDGAKFSYFRFPRYWKLEPTIPNDLGGSDLRFTQPRSHTGAGLVLTPVMRNGKHLWTTAVDADGNPAVLPEWGEKEWW